MRSWVAMLACVVGLATSACAPTASDVVVESSASVAPGSGHWVWTAGGWVWVPSDTVAIDIEGGPYAWLYLPSAGWGWYASPWGYGAYMHGPWAAGWHPVAWRGVAPHVVVHTHAGPRVLAHPWVAPARAGFHGGVHAGHHHR